MEPLRGNALKRDEQGALITPVEEDLKKAESMLMRELDTPPHQGKARMIAALQQRIAMLRKRMEREKNENGRN